MTEPSAPKASLTARLDERFIAPVRNASFARRTWFSITVTVIVFAHGALFAALLWRDREDPALLAKLDETPVEVVVEQPPAPQPPPQPPAAQPSIEKPATSAPRAPNDETVDKQAEDKDTHAPKAPAPAAAAPPEQSEAKADPDKAQPDKPDPDKADAEAKPEPPKPDDTLKKDAEALDKLTPPEPPKRPAKLAQAKPVKPHPKTPLQQLAGSSDLPDYTFAKPMKKRAKVTGGTEDDRYLAVVYGMITQQHRQIQLPDGEWSVSVSFQVDGHGQLVGVQVTQRSGYREIDMAAIEAVESAAPFPPPPSGAVTGLVARLRSSTDPRAMMAGQQY